MSDHIRYLTDEEKKWSRRLWERTFPEDSERFLNYYYQEKTKDNQILVLEDEGDIASMIHLNPYRVRIGEAEAEAAYIVAVATDTGFRRRGYMGMLLKRALKDMADSGRPFTFLMPARESIYLPYDFAYIYRQGICCLPPAAEKKENGFRFRTVTDKHMDEIEQMCVFCSRQLAQQYDSYAVRTVPDVLRLYQEVRTQDGGVVLAEDQNGIAACFSWWQEEDIEIREMLCRSDCRAEAEKGKMLLEAVRRYFADSRKKIIIHGTELGVQERRPVIMARITCLETMLEPVKAEQELSLSVEIEDKILPGNNGCFIWQSGKDGTRLRREDGAAELKITIGGLASWLFGMKTMQELEKEGNAEVLESGMEKLRLIRRFAHPYYNEIV